MNRLWLATMPQAIAGTVLLALPLALGLRVGPGVASILGGVVLLVGAWCAMSLYRPEET